MAEKIGNIHPGEVLQEDYLMPLEMTPYALAKGLGMTPSAIGEILAGKRGITPATALRLERFFGAEAQFWLNLQSAYDLEEQASRLADKLAKIRRCERVAA
jgi:addiction module HigA family antidote